MKIPRRQYNDLYGPTTGDRIRLADTDVLIEIMRDLTVPGEEAKFGGGKTLTLVSAHRQGDRYPPGFRCIKTHSTSFLITALGS